MPYLVYYLLYLSCLKTNAHLYSTKTVAVVLAISILESVCKLRALDDHCGQSAFLNNLCVTHFRCDSKCDFVTSHIATR